jgi:hypothetical protein
MLKGDFDRSNRDYFFPEVRMSDEKTGTNWCPFPLMRLCGQARPESSLDTNPPRDSPVITSSRLYLSRATPPSTRH